MKDNRFLKPCDECDATQIDKDGSTCYNCYGTNGYLPSKLGEELLDFLEVMDFKPVDYT